MNDLLTTKTLYSSETDERLAPELLHEPPRGTSDDTPGAEASPANEEQSSSAERSLEHQHPFIVEFTRVDDAQSGHFRPEASLIVTPAFRTSGLLQALPAEDLSSLLYMLTFLTPNGDIVPTVVELAQAMNIPERAAVCRMERLVRFRWQGTPLAVSLTRSSGLHAYIVSPHLIAIRHAEQTMKTHTSAGPNIARREAVIAHSRARYGKPRRYVEEMIAKLNNWDLPDAVPEDRSGNAPPDEARTLQTRLLLAGVSRAQADQLLAQYPLARIRDQLGWLPLRFAKSPDRFLVAAIEKNFAPPRGTLVPPSPEGDKESATALPIADAADEESELPAP